MAVTGMHFTDFFAFSGGEDAFPEGVTFSFRPTHISGMDRLFWTIRSWPSLKLMNEDCGNPVAIHFGKRCLSHGERFPSMIRV